MPNSAAELVLAAARASLACPLQFDEFLAKLNPKDRASAQRRVMVLDAEPITSGRAALWRRLACSLMTLAPFAAKLVGKQTLQIYVADGKYRMQVFALEDLQDGNFTAYCPEVPDEALRAGLVTPVAEPNYYVIGASAYRLRIERLDKKTPFPQPHIKDLTGWNRKALRITVPPSPSADQVEAAELLCAMAAQHFIRTAPEIIPPIAK